MHSGQAHVVVVLIYIVCLKLFRVWILMKCSSLGFYWYFPFRPWLAPRLANDFLWVSIVWSWFLCMVPMPRPLFAKADSEESDAKGTSFFRYHCLLLIIRINLIGQRVASLKNMMHSLSFFSGFIEPNSAWSICDCCYICMEQSMAREAFTASREVSKRCSSNIALW